MKEVTGLLHPEEGRRPVTKGEAALFLKPSRLLARTPLILIAMIIWIVSGGDQAMGLKVSTISRLPLDSSREYFVYFLDYGWDSRFSDALYRNFDPLAAGLAGRKGVVVAGLNRREFADEVLSWHSINGENAEDLLPAILLTSQHPQDFKRDRIRSSRWNSEDSGLLRYDGALLIPLRKICESPDDVAPLIEKILRNIRNANTIEDFEIVGRVGDRGPEMFLLQPNLYGVGVDLKAFFKRFGSKK